MKQRYCISLMGLSVLLIGSLFFSACGESQEQKIQRYIKQLGRKNTPNVRDKFLQLLVKQGDVAVGPLIRALKKRRDPYIRSNAATALARMGAPEAAEPIRDAMVNDSNNKVRGSSALALAELEGEAVVPDLVDVLKNDKDAVPRLSARQALANIGESAVADLIPYLKDADVFFRNEVREALEIIGWSAVPQLITALSEKNNTLRVELFQALAAIGDKSALASMKQVMQDYPAWDDQMKRHKNKLYKTLEGYYNNLYVK